MKLPRKEKRIESEPAQEYQLTLNNASAKVKAGSIFHRSQYQNFQIEDALGMK